MARVQIEGDSVAIRVSVLERIVLAEKSRKLPLTRIRHVDAHPALLDMMTHWSEQSGSWLCGVSSYDGHIIPSARHPGSTLAIEVEGEPCERIYVELDDESPTAVAERIEHAIFSRAPDGEQTTAAQQPALATTERAEQEAAERQAALLEALDLELDEEEIRHRDPLMQGSLPPGPLLRAEPAAERRGSDDDGMSRTGGLLVGLGSLGLLGGGVMLASGSSPGVFAVGAGVAAALLGGVALAVVARHQG